MWRILLWSYAVIFAISVLAETASASHKGGICKSAADLKNYPKVSRLNPKGLSDRDICWLDVYSKKTYGIDGNTVWFKTETKEAKSQIKSITYHTISIKELTDGTAPIKEKVSEFVKSCITRADIEAGYKFDHEIELENLAKSTGRRLEEKVTESVTNRVSEVISNRVSERISREVSESVAEEVSSRVAETVAEQVSSRVAEEVSTTSSRTSSRQSSR